MAQDAFEKAANALSFRIGAAGLPDVRSFSLVLRAFSTVERRDFVVLLATRQVQVTAARCKQQDSLLAYDSEWCSFCTGSRSDFLPGLASCSCLSDSSLFSEHSEESWLLKCSSLYLPAAVERGVLCFNSVCAIVHCEGRQMLCYNPWSFSHPWIPTFHSYYGTGWHSQRHA